MCYSHYMRVGRALTFKVLLNIHKILHFSHQGIGARLHLVVASLDSLEK